MHQDSSVAVSEADYSEKAFLSVLRLDIDPIASLILGAAPLTAALAFSAAAAAIPVAINRAKRFCGPVEGFGPKTPADRDPSRYRCTGLRELGSGSCVLRACRLEAGPDLCRGLCVTVRADRHSRPFAHPLTRDGRRFAGQVCGSVRR